MATRSETLNRLMIGSECKTSWGEMQGGVRQRFCTECRREVLDFERLTPMEIHAHLEASHGRLCARLTRSGGRLSVFEPAEASEPLLSVSPRRASSIAATLVTAWIGVGTAHAEAVEGTASATSAGIGTLRTEGARAEKPTATEAAPVRDGALHGRITDAEHFPLPGAEVVLRHAVDRREYRAVTQTEGDFRFASLPAGIYDLEAKLEGFVTVVIHDVVLEPGRRKRLDMEAAIDIDSISLGDVRVAPEPLRKVFADSDVVLEGVAGPSELLSVDGTIAKMATELRIETLFKGRVSGTSVTYRHSVYRDAQGKPFPSLTPGTKILAFLDRTREVNRRGQVAYEAVDSGFGIKRLDDVKRAAYLERLEALTQLEAKARRQGGVDPADVMEWLVGTAENSHTRHEATGEIQEAVAALGSFATREGKTVENATSDLLAAVDRFQVAGDRPALRAASLTEGQKRRLGATLQATLGLDGDAPALLGIVRTWDEAGATAWLVDRLRSAEPPNAYEHWRLLALAGQLDNPSLKTLAEAAAEQAHEIEMLWPDDPSVATAELREEKILALETELRHQFVEALADLR